MLRAWWPLLLLFGGESMEDQPVIDRGAVRIVSLVLRINEHIVLDAIKAAANGVGPLPGTIQHDSYIGYRIAIYIRGANAET